MLIFCLHFHDLHSWVYFVMQERIFFLNLFSFTEHFYWKCTSSLFLCHFHAHVNIVQLSINKSLCVAVWHLAHVALASVLTFFLLFLYGKSIKIYIVYCHLAKRYWHMIFAPYQPALMSPVAKKCSVDQRIRTESAGSVTDWTNKNEIGFLPILNTETWWKTQRSHNTLKPRHLLTAVNGYCNIYK